MSRSSDVISERRFTVEEYHRMAESGVFAPDERVELVLGVLRKMSPKSRAHVIAATRTYDLLKDALRGRASVYMEAPYRADAVDSEPQPDVLVCSSPDTEAYGTPRTRALLVVEVAATSLHHDLVEKAMVYARSEIPEYWVVDLVDRALEVFREPEDGAYQARLRLEPGATTALTAFPDLEIAVEALFPATD